MSRDCILPIGKQPISTVQQNGSRATGALGGLHPSPRGSASHSLMWIFLLAFAYPFAGTAVNQIFGIMATRFSIRSLNTLRPATVGPLFGYPLYPLFLAAVTFGYQAFIPVVVVQSLLGVDFGVRDNLAIVFWMATTLYGARGHTLSVQKPVT